MKRLRDVTDDDFVRMLTDPDMQDLDDMPTVTRDISKVNDDELARALTEPDLVNLG